MGNNNKIFSKSDNFKSEYSCAVVKVGELVPIEGSDFLAKTLVQGTQIVVRKDQVHTGDVMFYAANETQLSEAFLSINNQFEISCREKNANIEEVNAILKPYLDTKPQIEALRNEVKNYKATVDQMSKRSSKLSKEIKKMKSALEAMDNNDEEYGLKKTELNDKVETLAKIKAKGEEKNNLYNSTKAKIAEMVKAGEPYVTEAKKKVGFFGKYGRVRCLTLRGEPSFGYIFSPKEMINYDNSITFEDVVSYIGEEFDTVNGALFCKAYVPPIKEQSKRGERVNKSQKKIERFDRLDDNTFALHYDTQQLEKNIHRIQPTDNVSITVKMHGTSAIFGKLHVRYPKRIALYKRIVNQFCKWMKKDKPFIDYYVDWGPVYSSRTVIKNRYINKEVSSGFYNVDIWSEWGEVIYPYLEQGMTVYGEIIGKLSNGKYIQKGYDYGSSNMLPNFLMLYRITTLNEDGTKREWNVSEVKEWTDKLILKMRDDDNAYTERIHPIDILYHGALADLYPNIDENNHWHENVLETMKNDKEHFGMEELEPLCNEKVPREGVVIRIDDDPVAEAMKLKCSNFKIHEAGLYDSPDYQDIEVTQGDYNTDETV